MSREQEAIQLREESNWRRQVLQSQQADHLQHCQEMVKSKRKGESAQEKRFRQSVMNKANFMTRLTHEQEAVEQHLDRI